MYWADQAYECNLTNDGIALVVADLLMLGGCGMQLEGGSIGENILDRGTSSQRIQFWELVGYLPGSSER